MDKPYYIYVIRYAKTNQYKIGIAHTPTTRLQQLQTACPLKLELVLTIGVKNKAEAHTLERKIHKKLFPYLLHNEWFEVPKDKLSEATSSIINSLI